AAAALLDLRQPIDPVADAAGIDSFDLAEVNDDRPRCNPLDKVPKLVILVDDAPHLHIRDVVTLVEGCMELGIHIRASLAVTVTAVKPLTLWLTGSRASLHLPGSGHRFHDGLRKRQTEAMVVI